MSGKISLKTTFLYTGAFLFGILIGPLAVNLASKLWVAYLRPETAQAAEAIPAVIKDPDSPEATYICIPSYTGAFPTRVHVLCTVPAPGGIYYFAAPTSDSKNAARVLSIILTAKALGKNLQIYYDQNGDGSAFGCQVNDCRPINAIEMTK